MAPDRLPEPLQVALAVAATLERLGIPYVAERLGVSDLLRRALAETTPHVE